MKTIKTAILAILMAITTFSVQAAGDVISISTRERVMSIYRWVYNFVPPNTLIENVRDSITITYRNPEITMIGMNWGWNPKYVNNEEGWFALTGDWCVNTGSENLNWNIGRNMIYINGINL